MDFAYYSPCWQYRRCKDRVDLVSLLPKCVSLFLGKKNDTVDGCWWAVGYIYIYRWLQIIDAYLNLNFFFGGLWVDLPFVPFLCMGSLGYLGPRLAWLLMWDFRLRGEKQRERQAKERERTVENIYRQITKYCISLVFPWISCDSYWYDTVGWCHFSQGFVRCRDQLSWFEPLMIILDCHKLLGKRGPEPRFWRPAKNIFCGTCEAHLRPHVGILAKETQLG